MATIEIDRQRILVQPKNDFERARALQLAGANWRKSGHVTLPLNVLSWYQVSEEFVEGKHHQYSEEIRWWRSIELEITKLGSTVNDRTLETWDMPDLWETQSQAVNRLEFGSVALVDDRGMGKTRVVIEAIRRSSPTRAVVVAGKRGRAQWMADTALWWGPGHSVAPAASTWSQAATEVGAAPITVLTYDSLLNEDIRVAIEDLNPDWLIVDEAHNVKKRARKNIKKGDDGEVTKTDTKSGVLRSLPGARRVALTGTPMPNRWHEIWTILNFVAPQVFTSYWHFVEVLGRVDESFWGGKNISRNVIRQDIWNEIVDRWLIMRTRPQTGKVWSFVPVELSTREVRAYKEMAKNWRVEEDGQVLDASNHFARLVRLQQLAGGLGEWETYEDETGKVVSHYQHADPSSKTDALLEMLEGLDRAVVWTRFRNRAEFVAKRIEEHFPATEAMLITGATSEKQTADYLHRFKEENDWPLIAVCVYGTISEFVNELVAASDVFFLDWTTVKDVAQAADRCDRPGQTRQVRCVTLYARGTIDEVAIDREAGKVRPLRALLRDPKAYKFLEEIRD